MKNAPESKLVTKPHYKGKIGEDLGLVMAL